MWRMQLVFILFVVGFCAITARLFYWQAIAAEKLRLDAAAQYFLEFRLPATRGNILAVDGSPLVMEQPASLVFAQPRDIKDIETFARKTSEILGLDEKDLLGQLREPNRVWVPLARKVDQQYVDRLKLLDLPGLGFEKSSKRFYPEASMAAHLLGFVGSDQNGDDKGYFGIEGFYDRELGGQDGKLQLEKDVRGNPILIGEATRIDPKNGRSLTLWVDRTVQRIAERRLAEGIAKYGAKEGVVTIMDPKTGGILAMASYPSYDPRAYSTFDKVLYKNPIVATTFEPGSTFKVLVMAAAVHENAVTPLTTVDEDGPVKIGEYSVRTWNNEYHGKQTMTEVLQHSSNVGMVFVGKKLGKDKLVDYIKAYGFGELSGLDVEEEASPEIRSDNQWTEIDLATATFGQGIAVTPIQMVRAVGALANGGILMEPHLVKELTDGSGKVVAIKPKQVRRVISDEAARVITEMMVYAVDNGEAKWAKPKGYRVAGKTGTAQIPVAGHYDEKKTIASFVGYAPADNPKFVMLVTLREPTSSPWGSETAAPLFFTIARDIFNHYGVPPQ